MGLAVTLTGVLGVGAALAGYGFAALVYMASPRRWQNRLLAICLALEATYWGAAVGISGLTDLRSDVYGAFALHTYAVALYAGVYMLFVGTLDSPLAWPFRGVPGYLVAGSTVLGVWIGFLARPDLFIRDIVPRGTTGSYIYLEGPATMAFLALALLQLLYSVAVALDAYRRAPLGTAMRERAMLFAIAFGVRDVLLAFYLVVFRLLHLQDGDAFWQAADHVVGAAVPFVGMAFLAYGILRSQILEIDLRLKAGIARGTVAGAFAFAFFVGSEVLEGFIPVEGNVLGLVSAGAVTLVLRPLNRAAERLSDRLMPGVGRTPEYLRDRKGEVYRAAYESALESGGVTSKERATLDRLAAKLGIAPEAAEAMEADVLRRFGTVAVPATPGVAHA